MVYRSMARVAADSIFAVAIEMEWDGMEWDGMERDESCATFPLPGQVGRVLCSWK